MPDMPMFSYRPSFSSLHLVSKLVEFLKQFDKPAKLVKSRTAENLGWIVHYPSSQQMT